MSVSTHARFDLEGENEAIPLTMWDEMIHRMLFEGSRRSRTWQLGGDRHERVLDLGRVSGRGLS